MSGRIDIARWFAAEEATEWHRSQVQGFFYRNTEPVLDGEGLHVIRDLTKPAGSQSIWQQDGSAADYERVHEAMMKQKRFYCLQLIADEYHSPKAIADEPKADVA